jgi:hypothetical protein
MSKFTIHTKTINVMNNSKGEDISISYHYVVKNFYKIETEPQRVSRLYSTRQSCVRFINRLKRGDTSLMDKYLVDFLEY